MSIQILCRLAAAACLAALVAGCSSTDDAGGRRSLGKSSSSSPDLKCRLSRSSCLYNGQYEAGEKDYAEQAAKDLNEAEYERVRRGFR
jgi:major membrane immunogen (membrane-anchored lipoprotein)